MKNKLYIFILLLCPLLSLAMTSCSSSDPEGVEITITYDKLPAAARQFISDYYSGTEVTNVVKDIVSGITLYHVSFANGQGVTFNSEGSWTEITAGDYTSIPDGILPDAIKNYLNLNFSNYGINSVTRTEYGYDVNIANNVTLRFDFAGAFLSSEPN